MRPQGDTAGRANDTGCTGQRQRRTAADDEAREEGSQITDRGVDWDGDDSWKRFATSTGVGTGDGRDDRNQRLDTPQYQYESDRLAAGG
ncbi:MAG: hypothetical protein H8D48_01155 [Actinobacteria bacterium]|nr:hypothetical protein [Actinomycetota bacterium]